MRFLSPSRAATIAAVATSVSAAPTLKSNATIQWGSCPQGWPKGPECGTLKVPLDYSNPEGDTILLGIARLKASGGKSLGSLQLNPGGPGSIATNFVQAAAELPDIFGKGTAELLEAYDLVAADPRGVGLSQLVKCDPDLWNKRVSMEPRTKDEFDALLNWSKEVGESCERLTGPMLNHMDTIHVANDIELVRQALGDAKLNWVGLSYGTMIGYTYAEQFPDKVGRMLIDGVVEHSQSYVSEVMGESLTTHTALLKFFDWCKANNSCAFHSEPDGSAFFDALIRKVESAPIPAPDCESTGAHACFPNVTSEDIRNNIGEMLVTVEKTATGVGWIAASEALVEASKGNATALSTGSASSESWGGYSNLAVGCQDWSRSIKTWEDAAALLHVTDSLTPLTKGVTQMLNYNTRCLGWPAPVTNPQKVICDSINEAPPILMAQSFWDPASSVQWAVGVRSQIPNAHLIFRNGSGHTSFALGGDTSMASMAFLINGTLPADGTVYDS